jgi:hypothetical protein
VIPATSSWWLEHYEDFRRHLEERHAALATDPETCVAYELKREAAPRRPVAARRRTRSHRRVAA